MLTRRDLTRLLVRIFGLIILASAVVGLPLSIYRFTVYLTALDGARAVYTWQDVAFIGASCFVPFLAYTAVGLCFLWWGGRVIDRASLTPERGESEALVESTDLRNIEISVVAVLGLYFVADGLAELCRVSLGLGQRYGTDGSLSLLWHVDLPFFAEALARLVIGISLVLGRGGDHSRAAWRSRLGPKDAHMARLSLSLDCRYFAVGMITSG
jgi:hypothetical protein